MTQRTVAKKAVAKKTVKKAVATKPFTVKNTSEITLTVKAGPGGGYYDSYPDLVALRDALNSIDALDQYKITDESGGTKTVAWTLRKKG